MAALEVGGHQGEAVAMPAAAGAASGKRGRKKIQPKWSRIISFDDIEDHQVEGHEIQADLDALESNPLVPPLRKQQNWQLLFCPKEFWEQLEH